MDWGLPLGLDVVQTSSSGPSQTTQQELTCLINVKVKGNEYWLNSGMIKALVIPQEIPQLYLLLTCCDQSLVPFDAVVHISEYDFCQLLFEKYLLFIIHFQHDGQCDR